MTDFAAPGPIRDTDHMLELHAGQHEPGAKDEIKALVKVIADLATESAGVTALATIVGNLVADVSNLQAQVPQIGSIMSWSGSVVSIPANWHLCDGTGGTVNLKDAFIYGAGGTKNPGDAGGSATQVDHAHHSHTYTNANFVVGGVALAVNPLVPISNESPTLTHGTNLPPYIALCFIQRIS